MNGLTTRPLSPRIGVEIQGFVPERPIPVATADALRHLLDEHGLLLFRGADFSADAHVALLSVFGPVCSEFADGRLHTQMSTIETETDWTVHRLPFHQDGANTPHQHVVNSLCALDIDTEHAVPTYFANCHAAIGDLDPGDRARLDGLTAVHVQSLEARLREDNSRTRLDLLPEMPPESTHPRTRHPVLKPHPRTGRPLLFLTELQTSHIEGLDPPESERLVQAAFGVLFAPANGYVHHWRTGDLLLWDNYMLQHARARPIAGSRRTLRRVVVNPVHGSVPATKTVRENVGTTGAVEGAPSA